MIGPGVGPSSTGLARAAARRGGTTWVGPLPGNGDREVLIYRPEGWSGEGPVRLIVHFHGTYSEHVQRRRDGMSKKRWVGHKRLGQTLDAIDELQQTGQGDVALVYPLSAGKRAPNGHTGWWNQAFDSMWMVPDGTESFAGLLADARGVLVDTLGVERARLRARVTAQGHSAGGLALYNVAAAGASQVREYIFLDAAFEGWGEGCYQQTIAHKERARMTIVVTDRGIADPFAGRTPWCAEARAAGGADWDAVESWCHALATDMQDNPRVAVHHTRVRHGDQTRRFSGGLGLPADRFAR